MKNKCMGTKRGFYQMGSDGSPFGVFFVSSKELTGKQIDKEVDFMLKQWIKFGIPRFSNREKKGDICKLVSSVKTQ